MTTNPIADANLDELSSLREAEDIASEESEIDQLKLEMETARLALADAATRYAEALRSAK